MFSFRNKKNEFNMLCSDRSNKLKQIFSFFFFFLLWFELLWFFFSKYKIFWRLISISLSTVDDMFCIDQGKYASLALLFEMASIFCMCFCCYFVQTLTHSLSLCVFILFIFAYSCRALHIFSLICCFVYFSLLLLLYFVFSGFVRFESEF